MLRKKIIIFENINKNELKLNYILNVKKYYIFNII